VSGESERETRARRLREGIPVDATTWNELLVATASLGRDPREMNRLAGVEAVT